MTHLLSPAVLLAAVAFSLPALAQRFVVTPGAEVLEGDPISIVIDGLPPRAEVTITAERPQRDDGPALRTYRARARFLADGQGRIDLSTQAPLQDADGARASYTAIDLRGLFWSMVPAAAGDAAPELAAGPPLTEHQVRLTATLAGAAPVRQTITLRTADPRVITTAAAGFDGSVFARLPGGGQRPALIVLGGSEGGSYAASGSAPRLASLGYAVLGLPYYSPPQWGPDGQLPPELPGLPPAFADIPIERLEAAREWLARQPDVDASRIGLLGTSKGAEFVLLASSRMPWVRAVVAVVPSDVVWEGWGPGVKPGERASFAWRGGALPFVPYLGFDKEIAGYATGADVRLRRPQDAGRAANPDRVAAARIPVQDYAGPLLVIGGHDDQVWDSGGMAEAIARTRRAAGRPVDVRVYANAGHYLGGNGWSPTTQYDVGPGKVGGTPEGNARAQADAWAATVDFLQRSLGPVTR